EAVVPIAWLLGPTTVALAVPLYRNLRRIRANLWPVLVTLLVGGSASVALTLLAAWLLGADLSVLMTLATKSVTMPIA
ncbi:LrgB family protein, partial [Pseudoalteromonas sp. SIMBA_148]